MYVIVLEERESAMVALGNQYQVMKKMLRFKLLADKLVLKILIYYKGAFKPSIKKLPHSKSVLKGASMLEARLSSSF